MDPGTGTQTTRCGACAAKNEPGALVCDYCGAPLATGDSLGKGAQALETRFDALSSSTEKLLAAQTVPEVTARTLHLAVARVSENAAKMKSVLDAQARSIPRPLSAQETLVWLRRAPSLAWVSYSAVGHTRNFQIDHLNEVLAELYRDRARWESQDKGLVPLFEQMERSVQAAAPTVTGRLRRFARTNPFLAVALGAVLLYALYALVAGACSSSGSPRRSAPRRRRHTSVTTVLPSRLALGEAQRAAPRTSLAVRAWQPAESIASSAL